MSALTTFAPKRGLYSVPPGLFVTCILLTILITSAAPAMAQTPEFDPATLTPEELRELLENYTETPQEPEFAIECDGCGAPRPWESGLSVSTYTSVNLANGNHVTAIPITGWPGIGPDLSFNLYHNSDDGVWRMSYVDRYLIGDGTTTMTLVNADGSEVEFTYDVVPQEWVPETGYHWEFGHHESLPVWEIIFKDQTKWQFDDTTGKFTKEIDAAGNELVVDTATCAPNTFCVNDATGLRGITVEVSPCPANTMTVRETFTVEYNGNNVYREWTLTFDDCGKSKLVTVEDPMQFQIGIAYVAGDDLIEKM